MATNIKLKSTVSGTQIVDLTSAIVDVTRDLDITYFYKDVETLDGLKHNKVRSTHIVYNVVLGDKYFSGNNSYIDALISLYNSNQSGDGILSVAFVTSPTTNQWHNCTIEIGSANIKHLRHNRFWFDTLDLKITIDKDGLNYDL